MYTSNYISGILTCTEKKKTTFAISREISVDQSKLSRYLKEVDMSDENFLTQIKNIFGDKPLTFSGDDTTINKRYSNNIEGVSSMFDQSTKTFANCYKIMIGSLTDGKFVLPIAAEQWVSKEIMKDKYLTKVEVMQKVVKKVLSLNLNIRYWVFDGLYSTSYNINFLDENNCKFVMKIRRTIKVEFNGKLIRLCDIKELKLNANQNQKAIRAKLKGKTYIFIAVRRSGKHGEKIIYLIANFNAKKSKLYVKIYDFRWGIEEFIRTGKQHIGLGESFSRNSIVYMNHIKHVFLAYGILQLIMKKHRLKSPEDALKLTHAQEFTRINNQNGFLDSYCHALA